jgi:2'-5' RNA ligase
MPRLFAGLEIPQQASLALSMMRGGLPGARWIDPENYHITLRFIGDIDDRLASEVDGLFDQVNRRPFDVRFGEIGFFGGRKPRAIIVTVDPVAQLVELQADLERLLRRVGLEPEGRKFTPHVTLARLRDSSPHQVADYLSARGAVFATPFRASRFVLFSSKASVGGGPYVVEAAYPLAA